MPLTLLTGPANSAKARAVLDGVRAALDREPLLVVPTAADVARYRRELAEDGLVMGARVATFDGLLGEIARRAAVAGRPLGEVARERVVASVVARSGLRVMAASAATPGFARAAQHFFAEVEVARIDPGRLAGALRAWAGGDPSRAAYGEEIARLYGAYRALLDRLGRPDRELWALAALDALRLNPARWGVTPVFFYGFDDLTALELDAVEALAKGVDAEVWVSLTFERGRAAFAGRARTVAELEPLADRRLEMEPEDRYYAPSARAALHALERRLFEEVSAPPAPAAAAALWPTPAGVGSPPPPPDSDRAPVVLLQAGGERAEAELVAAEVLELVGAGVPPEEIAVVVRSVSDSGPLLERVLAAFDIPFALRRRIPLAHTACGAGLLALLRCATLDGTAADLVGYLRAPGVLSEPDSADRLEMTVRRRGIATAAGALADWCTGHDEPPGLRRVRTAAAEGAAVLCETLAEELSAMLAGIAGGGVLDAAGRAEAQAVAAGHAALGELAALARDAPPLAPSPAELAAQLGGVVAWRGDEPGPGRVTVCDPLALRARRVRALVVCGLQEGVFPRPASPEPFLSDAERRELARAAGVLLPRHEDALDVERYLFYATVSRPEERLVLATRIAGDDGDPVVPSFFLDDVRDVLGDLPRRHRPLGAVAWPQGAPTARAAALAEAAAGPPRRPVAIAPLRSEPVLRGLRERPAWSPSALELWARCPVKWFVERYLDVRALEPDSEPLRRGSVAHETLERTLGALREQTGSAQVRPQTVARARALLHDVLRGVAARIPISPNPERLAAGVRRLEADLDRYLDAAARDGSAYEPAQIELAFGFQDEDPGGLPALELAAPDGPLRVRGRIDRVDVDPAGRRAQVIDYKTGRAVEGGRWERDGSFQAAIYLRAATELLGLEPAGAFYQPLSGPDQRRRGLIVDDADPGLDVVDSDRRPAAEVARIVDAVIDLAAAAAAEARAGALEPRPDDCGRDGCSYPGLCRCEAA